MQHCSGSWCSLQRALGLVTQPGAQWTPVGVCSIPGPISCPLGREGKGVPWGRQRGSHHRLFALGFLKLSEKLTDDPSNTAGSLCSCGIEMPSVTPSVSPIATCMIAAHFWGRELSFLICAFLPLPRLHFLLFTALVLQEFQEVNLLSVLTAVSPARPF